MHDYGAPFRPDQVGLDSGVGKTRPSVPVSPESHVVPSVDLPPSLPSRTRSSGVQTGPQVTTRDVVLPDSGRRGRRNLFLDSGVVPGRWGLSVLSDPKPPDVHPSRNHPVGVALRSSLP